MIKETHASEVAMRVDGAPCMGEYMKARVAIKHADVFFWNNEYVKKFFKTHSDNAKQEIPGYFYMKKITDFDHLHTETGELYREFLKGDCQNKTGELCEWCKEHSFTGPQVERIPRPMPDTCRKGHYLDVFQTPLIVSRKPHEPDDYQPRANVKKLVKAGSLKLQDLSSINKGSYCVC